SMRHLTLDKFSKWLDEYGRAGRENDARASSELFSPDARYYESPDDNPMIGRDAIYRYWRRAAQTFSDRTSTYEVLALRDNFGIARWQSDFVVVPTGLRASLDCIFLVEFDQQGKCSVFREWWHWRNLTPGPQQP
ncbi:MAG: nuclear transport factor 2 family protein, partial [Bacteroidota bacterium]